MEVKELLEDKLTDEEIKVKELEENKKTFKILSIYLLNEEYKIFIEKLQKLGNIKNEEMKKELETRKKTVPTKSKIDLYLGFKQYYNIIIDNIGEGEAQNIIKNNINERIKNVNSFIENTSAFGDSEGPIDLVLYTKYDSIRNLKNSLLTTDELIKSIVNNYNNERTKKEALHPYED